MPSGKLPLSAFVDAARGTVPADLVFRNARVVNVLTGEIHEETVGVAGDRILGFGPYRAARPENEIDLKGAFLAPAFWDAHIHIESTMTTPPVFARLAAVHGTAAVVTDPHEIANVRGAEGLDAFLTSAADLPVEIHVMLPSCVPATHLETAGATLGAEDLAPFYGRKNVLGLAEMMNVPGFLFGDPGVRAKIEDAVSRGLPIDGHSPLLTGLDLNAYIGAGIRTDHECLGRDEATEKVRRGMSIWIREGTAAKNLDDLLPLVTATNSERFAFATDDRHPWDLLTHGHVDHHVRRAIAMGLDPVLAFRLASWSCARHYGFRDRGAIAPGFRADLVTFAALEDVRPDLVVLGGRRVAQGGELLVDIPSRGISEGPSFRLDGFDATRLRLAAAPGAHVRVIEVHPGSLATGSVLRRGEDRRRRRRRRSRRATSPSSPSSSGTAAPATSASPSRAASASPVAPSPPRSPTTRTTSSSAAATTPPWKPPSAGPLRSAAASSSRTAPRSSPRSPFPWRDSCRTHGWKTSTLPSAEPTRQPAPSAPRSTTPS